jgi:3-hydroxymyristoyl/3-hydroxydecanoyl-(acyl carrier protein) dehydratase
MRLRFVDRLVELEPRVRVVAEKCVTFEEAMLVRPGGGRGAPETLALEWLGQATVALVAASTDFALAPVVGSFAACRFGGRALAGDRARIEVSVRAWRDDGAQVDGTIRLDGRELLAIERATCAFLPLEDLYDPDELRAAIRAARGEFPGPVRT